MEQGMVILSSTALALGAFHTLVGPDHYLPFVAMAQTRKWSMSKTVWVVSVCGVGHVLSTIVLGALFISIGFALDEFKLFESQRGSIASWLLFGIGAMYTLWALYKLATKTSKPHTHLSDGNNTKKTMTFWVLFTIFVFGPCESLAGLLYTASSHSTLTIIVVAILFGLATISVMLIITLLILKGMSFVKLHKLEKYQHVVAGLTLAACGAAIIFLGL